MRDTLALFWKRGPRSMPKFPAARFSISVWQLSPHSALATSFLFIQSLAPLRRSNRLPASSTLRLPWRASSAATNAPPNKSCKNHAKWWLLLELQTASIVVMHRENLVTLVERHVLVLVFRSPRVQLLHNFLGPLHVRRRLRPRRSHMHVRIVAVMHVRHVVRCGSLVRLRIVHVHGHPRHLAVIHRLALFLGLLNNCDGIC